MYSAALNKPLLTVANPDVDLVLVVIMLTKLRSPNISFSNTRSSPTPWSLIWAKNEPSSLSSSRARARRSLRNDNQSSLRKLLLYANFDLCLVKKYDGSM